MHARLDFWLASGAIAVCCLCACPKHELRGQSTRSPDGGTYLIVVDRGGCDALALDGRPWRHPIGDRGPIPPGVHWMSCADGNNPTGFEVEAGRTFQFDYWGP